MAILKNILVTGGASRFLGHIYCQDISVSGTATLSSLSLSGNLSVTGTSTLSGNTTVGGTLGVTGAATFNNWITTANNYGWKSAQGGGWYMTDNNYVRSYNKPVMMGHDLYFNSTSYYVNTSGAASFSSIASPSATISNATISGDLTVNGVLQANDFIKNIVKAVGGQLYVSPTFQATDSTTVTCTNADASYVYLTLQDDGITSSDYAGATWYSGSKIMLSGTLTANTTGHTEEIIFSSAPGELTAQMNSGTNGAKKLQIKVKHDNANTYFKSGSLTTSDVAVMMYQINIPSGSTNAGLHPIGIYIKAYGTDNKNSYIDIFGGTSNTPNARLGLLTGLSAMQNGTTPSGWGIATTNGFFDGTIVSSSGKIGAFTLSSDLRSGTWGTSGSVLVAGGYTPTTADAKSIGGSPTTGNTWAFTAGNAFGVTTAGKIYASDADVSGKITATSGSIAGWRIESTYLASGTATAPAANVLLLSPVGTSSSYTVAGTAKSGWMITAGTTFGVNKDGGVYATSGQIGGVKIAAGAIYSSGKSAYNSNDAGFYLGSDGKFGLGKNNTYYLRWDGTNLAMNVQSLSIAGTNTATAISNAAGTASNYLYYDSTNGLVVSQTGVVATGYNTQITSTDGVNIRNGSTVLANYGSTVTIGQTTGYNTYIDGNGLNIRNGSTALATYGSTIILGKLAADATHVEIDSDSFDICSGATTGANSTKLATFGETATIGNMTTRGVSIDARGFRFNNEGTTAFRVGVDQRTGKELYLSSFYTLSTNNESITINAKEYFLLAALPNDIDVVQVGSSLHFSENEDDVLFAADYFYYSDWTVKNGKLWVSEEDIINMNDGATQDTSACYIYLITSSSLVQSPYCVIGNSAYSSSEPAGNMSFAQGYKCASLGAYSTSFGWQAISSGVCSISSGNNSKAYGNNSFAGGSSSSTFLNNSFAFGNMAMACGENSIALGDQSGEIGRIFTIRVDNVESYNDMYEITCSITEDADYFEESLYQASILVSTDNTSVFEGVEIASGSGTSNITFVCYLRDGNVPAANDYLYVRIDPSGSYGEGAMSVNSCCASDRLSTALGLGTVAPAVGLAIGTYNIPQSNILFSIGNGSGQWNRNNAMTVDMFGAVRADKFIGNQNILWDKGSSGWYMSADQDIPLSEAVSKQSTGIVLVWSRYNPSTSTTYDDNFHVQFVPKWFVANWPGKGETFLLVDHAFGGPMATKYVYVYDMHILGNANNTKTGTGQGVTYANNRYVLRRVIGV